MFANPPRPRRVAQDDYNELLVRTPGAVIPSRLPKAVSLEQSKRDLQVAMAARAADSIARDNRHFQAECWACGFSAELPPLKPGDNSEQKIREVVRTAQKCPKCQQRALKIKELRR